MKIRLKNVKVYRTDKKTLGILDRVNTLLKKKVIKSTDLIFKKSNIILNRDIDKIIDLKDLDKERAFYKTAKTDSVQFIYEYKEDF